jgi:membrane-bound lytic murein transglycosylase D
MKKAFYCLSIIVILLSGCVTDKTALKPDIVHPVKKISEKEVIVPKTQSINFEDKRLSALINRDINIAKNSANSCIPQENSENLSENIKKGMAEEFNLDSNDEIKKEVVEVNDKFLFKQPIEVILNNKVKKFIKLYGYKNGRWLYSAFKKGHKWLPYMRQIFKDYGLPEELVYLSLIESHFECNARSKAGAVGLWQFMRRTGLKYGLKINWWIDERKDPIISTLAAAKYLRDLYNMFGSYDLALAAYNAGEYKIKRLISKYKRNTYWKMCNRRYLKEETISYVPSYFAVLYLIRNNAKLHYIPEKWLHYKHKDYAFVQISKPYSLFKLSKETGIKLSLLKSLNPELKRFCTPPSYENYILKIPVSFEKKAIYVAKNINKNYKFSFKVYKIKKGDTLIRIAKKFHIRPLSLLKNFNNIKNVRALRIGQRILLPYPKEYSLKYAKTIKKYNHTKHAKQRKKTKYMKYRVKKGDSVWKVAKKYNVSINSVRMINGSFTKKIFPGDILIIKKRR